MVFVFILKNKNKLDLISQFKGDKVCKRCISFSKIVRKSDSSTLSENVVFELLNDAHSTSNFNQENIIDESNQVLNASYLLSQVSLEENISSEEEENSKSDEDQPSLKVKKTPKVKFDDEKTNNESSALNENEIITIKRTKKNKKNCLICKDSNKKLYKINQNAITDVYIKTKILISENNRACSHHFVNLSKHTRLKREAINKIEYRL